MPSTAHTQSHGAFISLFLSHSSLGSTPKPPVAGEPASPVVRVAAAVTLPPVGLPPRRAPAAAVLCGAPRRRVPAAVVLAVRGTAAAGAARARPRGELTAAAEAGVQGRALGPPVGEVTRVGVVEPAGPAAASRGAPAACHLSASSVRVCCMPASGR